MYADLTTAAAAVRAWRRRADARRVVIAAALLSEPDLLLLDEPTVGLDPVAAHEVHGYLAEGDARPHHAAVHAQPRGGRGAVRGRRDPIPALLAPFIAAVVCSTSISLLLTLLARDFRSANNLNGVFFVPVLLVTVGTLSVVGGAARTYVLAVVLLILAALAALVAMRWITFERYLE